MTAIENLVGSSFNDILTGSTTANRIHGGSGNDLIDGGAGIDTLDGGEDSDIYMLSVLGNKTAAEIADGGTRGTDELRFAATTAGTLTLRAGDTGLERVVIGTGTAATAVTTATTALNVNAVAAANGLTMIGNAGVNTLTGSAFADTIDGGAGADMLIGGSGNDRLIGSNGNDALTGGAGTDVLIGGSGNDRLIGGSGNDVLTGGAGADVFAFNFSLSATTNRDTIADFVSVDDTIELARSVMSGLGPVGTLSAAAFRFGANTTTAGDASDRIIYNTSTGALYYDADGMGGSEAVQFAQLTGSPTVSFTDFLII